MSSGLKRSLFPVLVVILLSGTVGADEDLPPRKIVERAMAGAHGIPGQATALVGLAWPSDGPADPLVQSLAREQLVHFGNQSLPALRAARLSPSQALRQH